MMMKKKLKVQNMLKEEVFIPQTQDEVMEEDANGREGDMMKVMKVVKEEEEIQNFGYDVSEDELLEWDAAIREAEMMF